MALGQLQRRPDGACVDVVAEPVLADQLQPLQAVPVRRGEQAPRHDRRRLAAAAILQLREGVGVHEAEHGLEHVRVDAFYPHADRGGARPRRAQGEELGPEGRRPGGEDAPEATEIPAHVGRRHRDVPRGAGGGGGGDVPRGAGGGAGVSFRTVTTHLTLKESLRR
ncbi:hypothetical protein PVAP13_8NG337830 [Panicum virgatum]|uniref:Uncharacterized protein n=1 Tax=Panicum virgatum TaxID=38727 RepID=A0A8T0PF43_PANVG|nr:hypothetical protein PVAP13_8NG337830 [Panicum virgatum]